MENIEINEEPPEQLLLLRYRLQFHVNHPCPHDMYYAGYMRPTDNMYHVWRASLYDMAQIQPDDLLNRYG